MTQVETSKWSIKDLFDDLLKETRGFKYQITLKVMLKNYKSTEIEFAPSSLLQFSNKTKTVMNHKFSLESTFHKSLYRIDTRINEGSDWIAWSLYTLTFQLIDSCQSVLI